jgi:hypothetical protein
MPNLAKALHMVARRFPPPWSVEEYNDACFVVTDSAGQKLACLFRFNTTAMSRRRLSVAV